MLARSNDAIMQNIEVDTEAIYRNMFFLFELQSLCNLFSTVCSQIYYANRQHYTTEVM